MERVYLQSGRAEQTIATVRVIVALLTVLIVVAQPELAGRHAQPLIFFTLAWLLWSAVIALRIRTNATHSFRWRASTHGVDIATATILVAGTQTPVSPLFPLVTLTVFSATLRFGVRGIALTGLAGATLYTLVALISRSVVHDPAFFAARITVLTIATLLLAYIASHQHRLRSELAQLAAWPRGSFGERDVVVQKSLAFAADLLGVERVVAAFEHGEEPWVWVASHSASGFTIDAQAPDLPIVTAAAEDSCFFCTDVANAGVPAAVARDNRVKTVSARMVSPEFAERLKMRSVLSAPFAGETVQGRLFFLDRANIAFEEMMLSLIVARLFATSLDEFASLEMIRESAVSGERTRVARDLHDTLMQSLTAMSLQLETVIHQLEQDPYAAHRRVRAVQELIAKHQTDMRSFIEQLRPWQAPPQELPLAQRLHELPMWYLQQWDIIVALDVTPHDAHVGEPLASEIFRIVNEGVANAARHAEASKITAGVEVTVSEVAVAIEDDGHGFPFQGTFTLAELETMDRGPRSLRERVTALGGQMTLHSSPRGARLEITLSRVPGRPTTL